MLEEDEVIVSALTINCFTLGKVGVCLACQEGVAVAAHDSFQVAGVDIVE